MTEAPQKVQAGHLKRTAYLYIRQSTPRQVLENTESTQRQYALRQRAVALGWAADQIVVIDHDLGQSGASAVDREGFQKLVTEVSMGRAGIVLGLEVSRLARNSADWHRLLEICALTDTLILDEDGIYCPSQYNDRLLLGLKGTLSEAELHVLYARMAGGKLNKAQRGELGMPLPIGLAYDAAGRVVLDPDKQVQQSVRLLFNLFRQLGSAAAALKAFRQQGLLFPRRRFGGTYSAELHWSQLKYSQVFNLLRNPRYAGAFVYGRHRSRLRPDGKKRVSTIVPREEWKVLLLNLHPGYISWEEYEENQRILHNNALAYGADRRKSPPREGTALLQGLALCGLCGNRMTVRYHERQGHLVPDYLCQQREIETAGQRCQFVPGGVVDAAIGQLLIEAISPVALDVALAVQQEMQSRLEEADRLRRTQVDRALYEARLAQQRYMQVDPANRLVADVLEADWNNKLRTLAQAEQEYERQRKTDLRALDEEQRNQIFALASDFAELWNDPRTPLREKKRMVRLLIEDVTLTKAAEITVGVRFRGGALRTITLPRPLRPVELHRTDPAIIAEIDRMLDEHTLTEIAAHFNERGIPTATGRRFDRAAVNNVMQVHGLKGRYQRLREKGLMTGSEIATLLGTTAETVKKLYREGRLRAELFSDDGKCLYFPPDSNPISNANKTGDYRGAVSK